MIFSTNDDVPRNAKIFVVGDDPEHEQLVTELMSELGASVTRRSTLDEVIDSFQRNRPCCVVTDIGKLSDGTGLAEGLAEEQAPHPVIVISGHLLPALRRSSHEGEFRWLRRPYEHREMTDAIKGALHKDADDHMHNVRARATQQRLQKLTDAERDVLKLLLEGMINKQIATQLGVSIRTVETRRSKIYKKMGVDSIAELVLLIAEARCMERMGHEMVR